MSALPAEKRVVSNVEPLEPLLTFDQFEAMLPGLDSKKRFELQQGALVEVGTAGRKHTRIAVLIAHLILAFLESKAIDGEVTGADGTYKLTEHDTSVPDVGYVSPARAQTLPDDTVFYPFAPDLAVEVRSPSQSKRTMHTLAVMYLNAGARLVWIVEPKAKTVTVYQGDGKRFTLSGDAELDGGDVLPGFKLSLPRIFDVIKTKPEEATSDEAGGKPNDKSE